MASAALRGAKPVLAILTALDLLTAFHGYLFANVVLTGAAPVETWPWFAWLFAVVVAALPIASVVCPIVAWVIPRATPRQRFAWAAAPLLLSVGVWLMLQLSYL